MPVQEHGTSIVEASQRAVEGTANDSERKLVAVTLKQDRLLYVCVYLLLNLAEDTSVERKMAKKVNVLSTLALL